MPTLETTTILFLALVALGAMVQTITGFAMGLIIMAGVAALGIADISFSAAVVSFISLANTLVALRHTRRSIDRRYLIWISVGLLPGMLLGMVLLIYLAAAYYGLLRSLLGLVIISAGVLLMITPRPYELQSGRYAIIGWGTLGGVIAGLYSAGGAPLAYMMYRQPLALDVVRATLLSVFAVSTLARSIMVAVAGDLNRDILLTAAFSIPVVILTTMLGGRIVGYLPDKLVRRLVFVLLIGVGLFLLLSDNQG